MMESTTRREFLTAAGGTALSALALGGCAPVQSITGKVTAAREEHAAPAGGDPAVPISVYVLTLAGAAQGEFRVFTSEFRGEESSALVGRVVTLEKRLGFWQVRGGAHSDR